MERGTVSMRVAFVLRSAEVQPLFLDLCDVLVWMQYINNTMYMQKNSVVADPPPSHYEKHIHTNKQTNNTQCGAGWLVGWLVVVGLVFYTTLYYTTRHTIFVFVSLACLLAKQTSKQSKQQTNNNKHHYTHTNTHTHTTINHGGSIYYIYAPPNGHTPLCINHNQASLSITKSSSWNPPNRRRFTGCCSS
jgi:hypothetical protein